jgi:uncharacterized protein YndB with AHSA1/START domain
MSHDLHFEMTYPQPPEHVWQALTNADAIAEWLMPNDFEPRIGHRFQFRTKPRPGFDGVVNCEVLELVPPQRLVYTWTGGGLNTKLVWTLRRTDEGTRLTLDHTGFSGVRGLLISKILGSGWRSKILTINLPALLSRWSGSGVVPSVPEAQCHQEPEEKELP